MEIGKDNKTKEFRIFGPPGTGKTTFLKKQIEIAAQKHGSDNVIVASYTKAAAEEINSRELPIPEENVGTLHALCYRAMGRPPLAETKDNIEMFNAEFPEYKITGRNPDMNGMAADMQFATDGDRFLSEYNVLRARCLPIKGVAAELFLFIKTWERWKLANDLIDYTDMITYTLQGKKPPPGDAKIGIYDEVQDFNRLQMNLIRHWAQYQEFIMLSGDDDQSIYEWSGASPDAFLHPKVGPEFKRVLQQSWRLPRAIQEFSTKWISNVKLREEKHFLPRDAEGEIKRCNADFSNPEMALEMADKYVKEGKSVMLLASCRYMIEPIRRELRRFGIPFHNPYQKDRGEWNPLGTFARSKDGKTTRSSIISFLSKDPTSDKPYWTMPDLANWASIVKVSDVFKRGAKTRIDAVMEESEGFLTVPMEQFCREIFREDALQKALDRNVTWFETSLLASKKNAAEYPIRVFEKQGLSALSEKPNIIISTIHGVKGGEADCSPYDEPVLTTNRGYVPIGDLNSRTDRLVSFNSDHHKIHRGGPCRPNGYKFTKGSRLYSGSLLTITTPYSKTRVTPNHYLTVRWAKDSINKFALYLMRRGNWWRIGVTKLHQTKHNQSGITNRLNREKGDGAWILGLYDTYRDALFNEQLVSLTSGIPDLNFEQLSRNNNQLGSTELHEIWKNIDSETPALKLLHSKGLSENEPVWGKEYYEEGKKRRRQTGLRNRWKIRASNLIPDNMEIPTDPGLGQKPLWSKFTIKSDYYEGMVYSLDVERWHHYVSGGTIVHNCVILFPDLSFKAMQQYDSLERDQTIRTFYVGMTRARESLILCRPQSGFTVEL